MPAVHKAISDNNKEIKKDFKYELKKVEDNIISINRNIVKEEIKENEEKEEEKRQLRSATYVEKIDNLKQLVQRNEEQRKHETEVIFEVLDSIKGEINSLAKLSVDHDARIKENKERISTIEKSKK